jgi:hypothetical protein
MDHVGSVAKRDTFDHLVDEVSQTFRIYPNCVLFQHLQQILLNVLEDEVEAALSKGND